MNDSKNDAAVELLSMASLYTPWALRAAATLRLADKVNEGATSVQELAELTGSNPDALARLMRHLVNIGVFSFHSTGGFHLDRLGRPLLSSNSFRVADMLDQEDALICALDEITPSLLSSLSSGNPSWSARYGTDFWAYFSAVPDRSRSFDAQLDIRGKQVGKELAKMIDWTGVETVADIGGGTGGVISTLMHSYPHLKGVLVDLPDTAQRAKTRFEAEGIAARVSVHGQSFFEELPPGADIYLFSRVLHDWPDRQCVRILTSCRNAAAASRAKVMVAEQLIGNLEIGDNPAVSHHDLVLMVTVGGRNRSEQEFRALAAEAGLVLTEVKPLMHQKFSLLKFTPET